MSLSDVDTQVAIMYFSHQKRGKKYNTGSFVFIHFTLTTVYILTRELDSQVSAKFHEFHRTSVETFQELVELMKFSKVVTR